MGIMEITSKIVRNDLKIGSAICTIIFLVVKICQLIYHCNLLNLMNDLYNQTKDIKLLMRNVGPGIDLSPTLNLMVLYGIIATLCVIDLLLGLLIIYGSLKKLPTVIKAAAMGALTSLTVLLALLVICDLQMLNFKITTSGSFNKSTTDDKIPQPYLPPLVETLYYLDANLLRACLMVYVLTLLVILYCAKKMDAPKTPSYATSLHRASPSVPMDGIY